MSAFVRENQIVRREEGGRVMMKDVELNIMTEGRKLYYGSHRRRTRRYLTAPKQARLNEERAWDYLGRLIDMNFGKDDYHLTLTYKDKYLPSTPEGAKADFDRFIVRAKKLYASYGVPLRYIMFMSFSTKKGEITRMHMHIPMSGGVPRDELEALWRCRDHPGRFKKGEEWKRYGDSLGSANCDRLQPDGNGLAALSAYFKKQPREGIARRWYASIGLKKPYECSVRDDRYSISDLREMAEHNADMPDVAFFERRYPGWTLCDDITYAYRCRDSEFSGLSIRVKLRRIRN